MDIERRSDPFGFQRFSACVWRWAKKKQSGEKRTGSPLPSFCHIFSFFLSGFFELALQIRQFERWGGVNFLDAKGVCGGFPRLRPDTQEEKEILVIFFGPSFLPLFCAHKIFVEAKKEGSLSRLLA